MDRNHQERIQRAATSWVKGLRGLTYDERLKALMPQFLEKRRLRNDLVLTHKILYNQTDLEATHLFKYSRRPELRKSSLRLLHQTGRTRRKRNRFACRVVKHWNRLLLSVQSVPEQRAFKNDYSAFANSCPMQTDTFLFPLIHCHNVILSSNKF